MHAEKEREERDGVTDGWTERKRDGESVMSH